MAHLGDVVALVGLAVGTVTAVCANLCHMSLTP
jgi:hypothetical protein